MSADDSQLRRRRRLSSDEREGVSDTLPERALPSLPADEALDAGESFDSLLARFGRRAKPSAATKQGNGVAPAPISSKSLPPLLPPGVASTLGSAVEPPPPPPPLPVGDDGDLHVGVKAFAHSSADEEDLDPLALESDSEIWADIESRDDEEIEAVVEAGLPVGFDDEQGPVGGITVSTMTFDDEESEEAAAELPPPIHMAVRKGVFSNPMALPIITQEKQKSKDAEDELNLPFSAFQDLREGQVGFIRYSIRPAMEFKSEAGSWIEAVKFGTNPEEEKSKAASVIAWMKYVGKLLWFHGNKSSKYLGGSAPPLRPGTKLGDAKPIPTSHRSAEQNAALKEAEMKLRDTAHFDVAMRIGVVGDPADKDDIERLADEVVSQFAGFKNEHQEIVFLPDAPIDAARGYMAPEGGGLALSSLELSHLAKIPDALTNPDGVLVAKTSFKHIPLPNPIYIDDALNPPAGMVPFGRINVGTDDEKILALPNAVLDQHAFYSGRTGSGKSEMMRWLIHGVAKSGYPLVLVDPHGSLSEQVLNQLIKFCPERVNDIVYCDLADEEWPVALNPLDVRHASSVELTVKSVMEMLAKQMALDKSGAPRATHYAFQALRALAEANLHLRDKSAKTTLLNVTTFFTDPDFRRLIVEFCDNIAVKETFNLDTGPFEKMNEQKRLELIGPIMRSFQELSRSDAFSAVFSSSENKLDFTSLINGNKIVIVKLARFHHQQQVGEFIGSMVLPYLLASLSQWGRQKDHNTGKEFGRGCRVFVDEAPRLLGPSSAAIEVMAEARKYDLGLIFATQYLNQLDKRVVEATLANTASKLALVLEPASARLIAASIAGASNKVTATDIAELPNYHFYGSVLLPTYGGGRASSPPFSAACLPPLDARMSAEHTAIRERVIENSRRLVSNAMGEVRAKQKTQVEDIKSALTQLHAERLQTDALPSELDAGEDLAIDLDADGGDIWKR